MFRERERARHPGDLAADTASNRTEMLSQEHQALSKGQRAQLAVTRRKRQAFLGVVRKYAPVTYEWAEGD